MKKTKKYIKSEFAKNIVLARNARGWKADKLAEKAEIPYPTLRDIEAGISSGRKGTKEKIAKALGREVWQLEIPNSEPQDTINAGPMILKEISEIKATLNGKNSPSLGPEQKELFDLISGLKSTDAALFTRLIRRRLARKLRKPNNLRKP